MPLAPSGTPFQLAVWEELAKIPYGSTVSYGDIARALGKRLVASRAVGLANGANPISIIVPCHRVIGSDGSLTGYGGGLERKELCSGWKGRPRPRCGDGRMERMAGRMRQSRMTDQRPLRDGHGIPGLLGAAVLVAALAGCASATSAPGSSPAATAAARRYLGRGCLGRGGWRRGRRRPAAPA